jgi:hypothetical protein
MVFALYSKTKSRFFNKYNQRTNLTQGDPGDPGTIGGINNSVVTTDGSGNATVRMTLTGPRNYVRAQSTD